MNPHSQFNFQISKDAGTTQTPVLPIRAVGEIAERRSFVAHGSPIATSYVTFLPPFASGRGGSFPNSLL